MEHDKEKKIIVLSPGRKKENTIGYIEMRKFKPFSSIKEPFIGQLVAFCNHASRWH